MDFKEAVARHQSGDLEGAERGYRAVLQHGDHASALCNLGLILKARGALAEAEVLLRRAVAANPANPTPAYNLGNFYWRTGRLEEAAPLLETAVALGVGPDAEENLGNVYLGLGRDILGWPLYDQRRKRLDKDPHGLSFPEWRGEALSGKRLFVWSEQGLGDQILAARFIRFLGAAEVTLVCAPELASLFAQLPAGIVAQAPHLRVEPHDYWSLPLSLPRWLGPVSAAPYLTARGRRSGGVGFAWRGNALPDPGRSLPAELARPILALPGVVSLQPEDTGATDFLQTAEIIAGLDLVVTVDTSIAHLAGAMGKRTLILLQQRAADWRWRADPAWYPSVEILRQSAQDDWTAPLKAAAAAISAAGQSGLSH